MKLPTTTSSLLLATMAMSPSLSSAAPTGMESSLSSPNLAGSVTPNTRHFPSSPLVDGTPLLMNRAPAARTGPGSPRRSIPSRLSKIKRQASSLLGPLLGHNGPLGPVEDLINGLTVPLLGLGLPDAESVLSSSVNSPLTNSVQNDLGTISKAAAQGGPGQLLNGFPLNGLNSLAGSLTSDVGGLPGIVGDSSGSIRNALPNFLPLSQAQSPNIISQGGLRPPNEGIIEDVNGALQPLNLKNPVGGVGDIAPASPRTPQLPGAFPFSPVHQASAVISSSIFPIATAAAIDAFSVEPESSSSTDTSVFTAPPADSTTTAERHRPSQDAPAAVADLESNQSSSSRHSKDSSEPTTMTSSSAASPSSGAVAAADININPSLQDSSDPSSFHPGVREVDFTPGGFTGIKGGDGIDTGSLLNESPADLINGMAAP